jgi:hypothetical protein
MHNDTEIFDLLKLALAAELEKQGSSLEEFEKGLGEIEEIEKTAAFDPISAGVGAAGSVVKGLAGLLKAAPELAVTGALMTGGLAGGIAYGANKHIKNQDKKFDNDQNEINRVRALTEKLKAEHGIQ